MDVGGNGVGRMHAFHESAIGRGVRAAGVNVLVIRHPGERIDLPPKQVVVKLLRPRGIVRRDFKPDDVRRRFFLRLRSFGFCAHVCF